jgi:hypothetical protein
MALQIQTQTTSPWQNSFTPSAYSGWLGCLYQKKINDINLTPFASQLIKVCLIELSRTRLAGKNKNGWVCTKTLK